MTDAAGRRRRRRRQGQEGQDANVDRAGKAVEPTGAAREGRRRRRGGSHGWLGPIGEKDRSMSFTGLADIKRKDECLSLDAWRKDVECSEGDIRKAVRQVKQADWNSPADMCMPTNGRKSLALLLWLMNAE